jgi:hypothetical protein
MSFTTEISGLRISRLGLFAIACFGLAMVIHFVLFPSPALAARGHEFDPGLTLGTPCILSPCGPGELSEPSAVAVNEVSHDIYVVDKFDSIGALA